MSDSSKIVVTLKAHKDFDAPWVVFHGDTVAEVQQAMQQAEALGLYVGVGNAATAFKNMGAVGAQLGGQPVQAPAQQYAPPPQAVEPPNTYSPPPQEAPANGPACQHGARVHKSGVKNGRPWAGWMCPSSDRSNQCAPQWANK